MFQPCRVLLALMGSLLAAALSGCAAPAGPPPATNLLQDVGHYAPAAEGTPRPRVAVPELRVAAVAGFAPTTDLNAIAGDVMARLLESTGRFSVVDRGRLGEMLAEVRAADAVQAGSLLRPIQLRGVRFIVLGQLLNLSVTADDPASRMGVSKVKTMIGLARDRSQRVQLSVAATLDIRLVEPGTKLSRADVLRDYRRSASAEAFGVDMSDKDAGPDAPLVLNSREAKNVLQIILDDAVRHLLPQVDQLMRENSDTVAVSPSLDRGGPATPPPPAIAPTGAGPTTRGVFPRLSPAIAHRICPECGAEVSAFDEFCPNCGAKLPK